MVSIHRPLGYGPSTLPLRHSAWLPTAPKLTAVVLLLETFRLQADQNRQWKLGLLKLQKNEQLK